MESASKNNPQSIGLKSRFIAALMAFGLLSVGLAAGSCGQVAADDFPVNTWTTWAIKDFLSPGKKSDVVFMGSSLMLVPLDGTDADFLGHRIDASAHHQSCYFEDRFKRYSGLSVASYNFALPGEMPSDAALITKFLLKGEKGQSARVWSRPQRLHGQPSAFTGSHRSVPVSLALRRLERPGVVDCAPVARAA